MDTTGPETGTLSPQTAATLAEATTLSEAVVRPGTRRLSTPRVRLADLRDYQKDAVRAAVRHTKLGGRGILEMACGAGKTLVSATCAKRLAPYGRALVLVPTIELLEQTATSWSHLGGRRGVAIAACSKEEALDSAEAGAHIEGWVTTDAAELADLVTRVPAGHPVTVYATYASLERLVRAHDEYGLPQWDLVIVDEAHRTAGALEKSWAAVHEDAKVPALRRLYFTATPRIAAETPGADLSDLVMGTAAPSLYSMDNETVFGPTIYRWSFEQGVVGGWIADYKILVPVVTDQDLCDLLSLPSIADLRSQRTNVDLQRLALQVAVLRAIADLSLRRIISFHARITYAREFAATITETAALLPDYDRPERIWARAVAGTDPRRERQQAFDEFRRHTGEREGEEGEECGILCNARLLAEGIDMPAVDAIVFADPKTSVVDIVQALGRAVRQKPQEGKVAYVIIPVYLPSPDADSEEADDLPTADPAVVGQAGPLVQEEAEQAVGASAYAPVLHVLRALASVDSRVVGRVADLRTHRHQGHTLKTDSRLTTADDTEHDADGDGTPNGESSEEDPLAWLRIDATRHQSDILRSLKLRMFSPRAQEFERMLAVATVFYIEHGHLDPADTEENRELRTWLRNQRHLNETGTLNPARKSELDAIGMIWSKTAQAWERGLAYAKAYHHFHADLAIPSRETLDDYNVGRWMHRQRNDPDLTAEQQAALDALDPLWRLAPEWSRTYRRVVAYLQAGGTLTGPVNRAGGPADPTLRPGKWLPKQDTARAAGKLTAQQITLLDALREHLQSNTSD
ncbi:Helicase associated domain protein [Kitasatospora sp. NPDC058965]|uniref:DEAD/DEAH box helicase n=1 Tax=Kitasatospora sp. NPDC058965 TaxID=3346682 RepID=UPI00367FEE1E